jgi:hypothetical protein
VINVWGVRYPNCQTVQRRPGADAARGERDLGRA